MAASPAIYNCQEGHRSNDAHLRLSNRAILPARGRVIFIDPTLLPIEQVIRPSHPIAGTNRRNSRAQSSRAFSSVRIAGSRRLSAHTLPAKQSFQLVADRSIHLNRVLSNVSSCAGSTNASKRGQIIGNLGQVGAA